MNKLVKHWYRSRTSLLCYGLLPFSYFFQMIVLLRLACYRFGIKKTIQFDVPIVVIGNITVGGTGKTPLVIWLANKLSALGFKPGIVSRGAGGAKSSLPREVDKYSDPVSVGDEAILLAKRTECPVVICRDRVAAVSALLEKNTCNIIISDDGLQHYRLGREIEIAMIDGVRRFGNKQMLPAGPLRESVKRLKKVNYIVTQGKALTNEYDMQLEGKVFVSLLNEDITRSLPEFEKKVHAVAAIGNPSRFFQSLRELGFEVIEHVFPDHYQYKAKDIQFGDQLPIVMTEKDAVKCKRFADEKHWFLPVEVAMPSSFLDNLMTKLKKEYSNA